MSRNSVLLGSGSQICLCDYSHLESSCLIQRALSIFSVLTPFPCSFQNLTTFLKWNSKPAWGQQQTNCFMTTFTRILEPVNCIKQNQASVTANVFRLCKDICSSVVYWSNENNMTRKAYKSKADRCNILTTEEACAAEHQYKITLLWHCHERTSRDEGRKERTIALMDWNFARVSSAHDLWRITVFTLGDNNHM